MNMKKYTDLYNALIADDRPLSKRAAKAIRELLMKSQSDMAEITRLRRQIGGMLGE